MLGLPLRCSCGDADRDHGPAFSSRYPPPVTTDRNAPAWVTVLLLVLGVALIIVGIVYFAESAGSLPSFFPGHQAGSSHHHTKHGIAAVAVGLAALVGAWISTGKKRIARQPDSH